MRAVDARQGELYGGVWCGVGIEGWIGGGDDGTGERGIDVGVMLLLCRGSINSPDVSIGVNLF